MSSGSRTEGALGERTALVTGASRGIGRAVARALAGEGMRVAAVARHGELLEDLAREAGPRLLPLVADLTREEEVAAAFDRVRAAWGRLDLLVNSAGAFLIRPAAETTLGDWHLLIGANLTATFLTCREAVRLMAPARRGTIVNISSVGGRIGLAEKAAYCASKFGVVGLSRALAKELRPQGIKVHVLYPYVVDSAGRVNWAEEPDRRDILSVEDVAETILFLARLPARVASPDLELNPQGA